VDPRGDGRRRGRLEARRWSRSLAAAAPAVAAFPGQPTVVAALNSSALYLGEAIGAGTGGIALGTVLGFAQLPLVAAGLTVLGISAHLLTAHHHAKPGQAATARRPSLSSPDGPRENHFIAFAPHSSSS
jgi:hypothetical protein